MTRTVTTAVRGALAALLLSAATAPVTYAGCACQQPLFVGAANYGETKSTVVRICESGGGFSVENAVVNRGPVVDNDILSMAFGADNQLHILLYRPGFTPPAYDEAVVDPVTGLYTVSQVRPLDPHASPTEITAGPEGKLYTLVYGPGDTRTVRQIVSGELDTAGIFIAQSRPENITFTNQGILFYLAFPFLFRGSGDPCVPELSPPPNAITPLAGGSILMVATQDHKIHFVATNPNACELLDASNPPLTGFQKAIPGGWNIFAVPSQLLWKEVDVNSLQHQFVYGVGEYAFPPTTPHHASIERLEITALDPSPQIVITDEYFGGVGNTLMMAAQPRLTCNDHNACTDDSCDDDVGCVHTSRRDCSDSVGAGGTVTTDTGTGASPDSPLQVSVTTPNAGMVSIKIQPPGAPPTPGFAIGGLEAQISAPAASPSMPLVLVFRIDASQIPAGATANTIRVLKDGVVVPACTGAAGVASPNPCVSQRTALADGDVRITVLTSSASLWSFGAVSDHFQCYDVHNTSTAPIGSVSLIDQFGAGTVAAGLPKRVCNPADTSDEDPDAPTHPDHLVGYKLGQRTPFFVPRPDQPVVDEFGALVVDLVKPDFLLVPSAKSVTGPVPPNTYTPAVDHYTCYRVAGARRRVPNVNVVDEFGALHADIKRPLHLCVPTAKNGGDILDPATYLMCYETRRRSSQGFNPPFQVFVDNQFGPDTLNSFRPTELCVPALNNPGGPTPTPTAAPAQPTPTPTETATPIPTATETGTPTPTPATPVCGDGVCDSTESVQGNYCATDCCGDGFCDPSENEVTCPADCP